MHVELEMHTDIQMHTWIQVDGWFDQNKFQQLVAAKHQLHQRPGLLTASYDVSNSSSNWNMILHVCSILFKARNTSAKSLFLLVPSKWNVVDPVEITRKKAIYMWFLRPKL